MPTNAQSALAAAAALYQGRAGYADHRIITAKAAIFKGWLDAQDEAEPEQRDVQLDALVIPGPQVGEPELIAGQQPEPIYPGLRLGFQPRNV